MSKLITIIESIENPGVIYCVTHQPTVLPSSLIKDHERVLWSGVASSDAEAFEKFKELQRSYQIPEMEIKKEQP